VSADCVIGLDLATTTGWAVSFCGIVTSGTISFKGGRFEGGGMRFLRLRKWLREMIETEKPAAVCYEELRRHMSPTLRTSTAGCSPSCEPSVRQRKFPYAGIVGTIERPLLPGKGNADKAGDRQRRRELS
jgi:hypothetical protein